LKSSRIAMLSIVINMKIMKWYTSLATYKLLQQTVPVTQMTADHAHLLLRRLEPLVCFVPKANDINRENSSIDEPCHLASGIRGANTAWHWGWQAVASCQDQQTVHFSEATLWECLLLTLHVRTGGAHLAMGFFIGPHRARTSDQLLCDLMLAKCNSK